jgi:hypothetical protein
MITVSDNPRLRSSLVSDLPRPRPRHARAHASARRMIFNYIRGCWWMDGRTSIHKRPRSRVGSAATIGINLEDVF